MQPNRMIQNLLLLAMWLGGLAAVPGLHAQPAARKVDSRLLFVFDTSAEMKQRVKAVQTVVNSILATSAGGQLHSNNSIGVWTFDQQLQSGQFPLQRWNPDQAVSLASNITKFVGSRRYSKKTSFEALLPMLGSVVQGSERLMVVICCDGDGELKGTPYDTGINQIFQQRQAERHKTRQPIVIVLYSQLGQYVDCMVSFPPEPINFPAFPPLRGPVVATPPPAVATPAPPRPIVPPLIVIGTPPTNRVSTPAPNPLPLPTHAPVPTNPPAPDEAPAPPPAASPEQRSLGDAPVTRPNATPAQLKISPGLLHATNEVSSSARSSWGSRAGALAMGVGFLAVAGGLTWFLARRIRSAKKD